MSNEFPYTSTIDVKWNCIVCNNKVDSEAQAVPMMVYTPASRYWLAGSKPGLTCGVFCGVNCSQRFVMEK